MDLSTDRNLRNNFLKNPHEYILLKNYRLSQEEIAWLMYRFSETVHHNKYDPKSDIITKQSLIDITKEIILT